ncbi:hypothetical protein AMS68_001952 [Peltaster fructicola]|uniref:NADH:flavin oxidoreductase/NADH oxidase N-terminal domain-containing protein n=1 Tax=Peltaster fructicola TaxID=286661 RepID=A0A6H0XP79_9PEZI|nr:hypothetical protein AMS68_001952 [Peltaster fructicola]
MAFTEYPLPNGSVLKNRIVKAAMEELMADVNNHNQPSQAMLKLYSAWGKGGSALILSGHVMIDPLAMASPGNTLLADHIDGFDEKLWRQFVGGTKQDGAQFYLQINHPGRQMRAVGDLGAIAPSAVPLKMGALSSMFPKPRAMTIEDIERVKGQFAWTAKKAEELGCDGVQIHAAHGYLLSQFLSPLSNVRTDQYGGTIENRARLLFEIVRAIREQVSPAFGVGVKINSADFQRGGFDNDDLHFVVKQLNSMKVDFIELSGGSYEAAVMIEGHVASKYQATTGKSASTLAREAYFIEAAQGLEKIAEVPLIVTGGIRTKKTLDDVLATSPRLLAGIGVALGLQPDLPNLWQRGEEAAPNVSPSIVLPKAFRGIAQTACVRWNMRAIGNGKSTWHGVWPTLAFLVEEFSGLMQTMQYSRWLKAYQKKH